MMSISGATEATRDSSATPLFPTGVTGNSNSATEPYWYVTDFIKSETFPVPDLLGQIYKLVPNSQRVAFVNIIRSKLN